MFELPVYVWIITLAGAIGIATMTCVVLYRGAIGAGLSRRRITVFISIKALALGGWFIISAIFAANGGYRVQPGELGFPWLPTAVVVFLGSLFALTFVPTARKILNEPSMTGTFMQPHGFRVVGVVFLIAMGMGYLPAAFAIPAGVGDIAVSIATPFVVRKLARGTGRRAALWFNALGIADLMLALVLGALVAYGFFPGSTFARAISELPLVLIPTAAVPILFVLHIRSLFSLARLPKAQ
ncbi:hypothetical protein [Paenibacillus glycinis]|uniref:Uncharacterized protein n=1 Tax=Paenibacillus glycinis TaxID=2697035 RepID=A0ABW9XW33_9BACL|nr:hypothetical protein [Paenibacillus glycinis]NBD26486.1 hypothetical protein [Paenibacillus glycinis]